MKIHVIDNLLVNFKEYKDTVNTLDFGTIVSQGQSYSDMSQAIGPTDIYNAFEKKTGMKTSGVKSFIRAYIDRPEHRHKMWIHSDTLFSDYIGIFMVQSSEFPQDDGVCLWFNKDLKAFKIDTKVPGTSEGLLADSQTMDPEKWTMVRRFEFKENRLVVFPASYFHSKATVGNHGHSLDDCRIVHVIFFNEVKDEK